MKVTFEPGDDDMLTLEQVCERMGEDAPTVRSLWHWLRNGVRNKAGEIVRLKSYRLGRGGIRTTMADVKRFAEERQAGEPCVRHRKQSDDAEVAAAKASIAARRERLRKKR